EECLREAWLPVDELERAARKCGVTSKTLRRAKEALGVKYKRVGYAQSGVRYVGFEDVEFKAARGVENPYSPIHWGLGEKGKETPGDDGVSDVTKSSSSSSPILAHPHSRPSPENENGQECKPRCPEHGSLLPEDGLCRECEY